MGRSPKHKLWLVLGAIAVFGLLVAWQHTRLLTWYFVRELATADAANRAACVDRVVSLDAAALPRLLEILESRDAAACANGENALTALVHKWGSADARTSALAETIHQRFSGWGDTGQNSALRVMAAVLLEDGPKILPATLARAAGDLLATCQDRAEQRTAALVLAGALLDRAPAGSWLDLCRVLADKALVDRRPDARLAAVQLLARPALQGEHSLFLKVVPLLGDDHAAVRRAALAVLAPARDLVSEDDLLPRLHDPDAEVVRVCEAALRSRGLSGPQIELARLISDARPQARLKVLERLRRVDDLEPSVWLRRLSQDSCSAIRAAAVRATTEFPQVEIADRLHEMAQHDPSETVRQNARHYLNQRAALTPAP